MGAGPASLTVARDLAPLGYDVTVFDGEAKAGGFMRTQIPQFRLPESVIDEETGYILDLGVDFRPGQRIDSMKALLGQGYDAIFVGCGAPRGRDLDVPGRKEAAAHIHIGIDWLMSVSFGHITRTAERVIVLGGGNTAMDCCRSARRLGGKDVKVIVRSGFEEMKASPWEKEDAQHEGIPILNYHVPKSFEHENGKLTGMTFEIVRAEYDAKGRRSLVPTGEPDVLVPCDEVLVAVGQENAFPWIERDCGIEFDKWGLPVLDEDTFQSTVPNVFFGGDSAFGPKNIITAVAHGHEAAVSIDRLLNGEDVAQRPPPMTNLMSQKMGIHEWSYDNDVSNDVRFKVPWAKAEKALASIKVEVELGFDAATAFKEASRCLNCDVQTVFNRNTCIECDACVDICPMDCITFTANGDEADLRTRLKAPATHTAQDLYVSAELQDRPRDGQGRGRLPALRPVRRALPDRAPGTCRSSCSTPRRRGRGAATPSRTPRSPCPTGGRMKRIEAINDFVIKFANVNGSGSASANELFAKAVMRMGVPVSPRNIFPSNIQGLPTWYEARVCEKGYHGRRGGVDMMVAMNPQTWDADVAEIEPGGYLFYDSTRPMPPDKFRDDVHVIGMPLTEIATTPTPTRASASCSRTSSTSAPCRCCSTWTPRCSKSCSPSSTRARSGCSDSNIQALHLGRDYVKQHLQAPLGIRVQRSDKVGDQIFTDGNSAAALGCVYGGATVAAWYPITPSSSVPEAFQKYCDKFRVDPATGQHHFAIVQAEDELASIGMVVGAGWNGARAFTATSGPAFR